MSGDDIEDEGVRAYKQRTTHILPGEVCNFLSVGNSGDKLDTNLFYVVVNRV